MLQITLTQKSHPEPLSEMSEDALFTAATRSWVLNPSRAGKERFALIVAMGEFVMAIEIQDIVLAERASAGGATDDRYDIVGTILRPGHEVHDTYVGHPAKGTRNPVRYPDSPFDLTACKCGCGGSVRSDFLPGHDQRAIHERIAHFGTVARFLDWFDATYDPNDRSSGADAGK